MPVHRHLRPLAEAGVLELRYPERPNHRKQAYRVRREDAPPEGPPDNAGRAAPRRP